MGIFDGSVNDFDADYLSGVAGQLEGDRTGAAVKIKNGLLTCKRRQIRVWLKIE